MDGHIAGVGQVLGVVGSTMLELVASLVDAARNRELHFALDTVPFESDAAVEGTCPIAGELVLCTKRGKKMVCMFLADALDSKILDD